MITPWGYPEEPAEGDGLAARLLEVCDELAALQDDAATYGFDISEAEQRLLSELRELELVLFANDG